MNSLVVFSKLAVHQIHVEPKRVRAAYTLTRKDGSESQNELIYSYEIPLFDPRDWQDVNLASMMLAQVALNYGLFCEEIVFDGLYAPVDKRFLMDMMENTSREIWVMKILRPNPFLKASFEVPSEAKRKTYTSAKVIFENTRYADLMFEERTQKPKRDRYAILSSGGKDSLLTYGIVREMGEPHPVFINESGRHWFTAINSYKYLRETEPNTVKPWCNSDRIFNWMVRQMPFIKENFQDMRADSYPIRLWTVAVFLFGVLPVVMHRNIANILIGNEYDTTVKGNHEGVSHYNGLYDQSKYFDNALTRYYRKKGWNRYQYSMLRSLSELLILKVLVKRYPRLQEEQVSCHAAHESHGRILPCGKCEKCRRIIGMLKALDEDPRRCGYSEEQIVRGLSALAESGVKQLGSDAAHLYYLLLVKDWVPSNAHTRKNARPHPEILQLRFDTGRSTLGDLPEFVRKPLFNILRDYADGAVRLREQHWSEFDLDNEMETTPYFIHTDHEDNG